jgi:UDP:flavonoid glycosyltransferase YjiC (YdhE family)
VKVVACAFGSAGFLYPMICAARAIGSGGHEVLVVSGPESAPVLAGAGLTRFPRPGIDGPSFTVPDWGNPASVAIQLKHAAAACDELRPDLMLTSILAIGPLLAAERRSVPVAVLGQFCHLWPADEDELARRRAGNDQFEHAWRYRDMGRIYAVARDACGLPPRDWRLASFPMAGDRLLLRSAPGLEPSADKLEAASRVGFVGACAWEPEGDVAADIGWARSRPGNPVLYAYLGRTFGARQLWPWLLDALNDGTYRAFAVPSRSDEEQPSIPPFVRFAPGHSQSAVVSECALVTGSATSTAALAAVQSGLPLLGADSGGEQGAVAAALTALGMFRTISDADPAGQVASALADEAMSKASRAARDMLELIDSRAAVLAELCRVLTGNSGAGREPQ